MRSVSHDHVLQNVREHPDDPEEIKVAENIAETLATATADYELLRRQRAGD